VLVSTLKLLDQGAFNTKLGATLRLMVENLRIMIH